MAGTLTDDAEKEPDDLAALPEIYSLPLSDISSCNLAKEKVHELILPEDKKGGKSTSQEKDFRLYIPSFIRHMHGLLSRPPELLRKDSLVLQTLLESMPVDSSGKPSYKQTPIDLPDECLSHPEQSGEPSMSKMEPVPEGGSTELGKDLEKDTEPSTSSKEEGKEGGLKQNGDPSEKQVKDDMFAAPTLPRSPEKNGEAPSRVSRSTEEPFVRDYIMKKVEDLEQRLKNVNRDITGSKGRHEQLKRQVYEMEILKLVEKISKDDTPSETDVAKLEYLTNQLKIAQGMKTVHNA